MSGLRIADIRALQILDSRGYPSLRVQLENDAGRLSEASAPSGAATGAHEAVELRDGGAPCHGPGDTGAIPAVSRETRDLLASRPWASPRDLDVAQCALDGTENKSRLGANALAAVSATLRGRGLATVLGGEGGYAPEIPSPGEALDLIMSAIDAAGCRPGLNDVATALDPAANSFFQDGVHRLNSRHFTASPMVGYYGNLLNNYPIRSLEDPLAEDDAKSWPELVSVPGGRAQIVGDDLFVTQSDRVSAGIGSGCGELQAGAPARGERVAKYNRLLDIAGAGPTLPCGPAPQPKEGLPMPDHHKRPQTQPDPMSRKRMAGPVVAGVVPGQPAIVVRQAAALAYSLGVGLVFAYVDITRYLLQDHYGADDTSAPIDPDGVDEPEDAEGASRSIRARIGAELGDGGPESAGPGWSFVTLAGEPARALARFAESVQACVIVVGTRERGVGARLEEFLIGSVAVHLTHRQHRPVLVIPLGPHPGKGAA